MADEPNAIVEDITGGLSFSAAPPEIDPLAKVEPHTRPDHVPEKFWNADKGEVNTDALLKSYGELEKQFSAPKDPVDPDPKDPADPDPAAPKDPADPDPKDPADPDPKDPEDKSDLSPAMEAAQQEYRETGTISEESRAPFLAAGISNDQINLYLAGVKAQDEGLRTAALKGAGVENFSEIETALEWAKDNWSEKKILAFNSQAADIETIGDAAKTLYQAFSEANPGEGKLLAVGGGVPKGDVYSSKDEYSVELQKADALPNLQERRLARSAAVAKMQRSIKAKSIK